MVGLLGSPDRLRGLLSMASARNNAPTGPDPRAAAVAEAMGGLRRRYGGEDQRQSLLSAMQPQPEPQRNRVSGWRVLDRVLGGQTISEGLDSERERETARAMQMQGGDPRMHAVANTITDPRELALFAMDPEAWSKNVGQQFAPQVVGAGAAQVVAGRRTVDQPQNLQSGDTIVQVGSGGARPIFTRTTPSIAEAIDSRQADTQRYQAETGRISATSPMVVSQDAVAIDPQTGREVARGNRSPLVLAPDARAFTPDGIPIADNPAPRVSTPADDEDYAAIEGYNAANQRFSALLTAVAGDPERDIPPAFDLSPMSAAGYRAALATGIGMTPEAAAYGNYVSEVESAVSESLRLNTGPQTDQDAVREARALLSNVDNRDYVLARLPVVIANNERLRNGRQRQIDRRRSTTGSQGRTPQAAEGVVSVRSPEEAAQLPPGTRFRTPDGRVLVRQ